MLQTVFFDLGDTLVVSSERRWLPGAKSLLGTLRGNGLRLGVISNTGDLSREAMRPLLPDDFSWSLFDADLVILSSEVGVAKPSPRIFEEALRRAGGVASSCLFCTEDLVDTLVAQQVGMRAGRLERPPHSDVATLAAALHTSGLVDLDPAPDDGRRNLVNPSTLFSPEQTMAKKQTQHEEPQDNEDLAGAVQDLTKVAQSLANSAQQMMQTMVTLTHAIQQGAAAGGAHAAGAANINVWEDDPFSEKDATADPAQGTPIQVPVPVNNQSLLQFKIVEAASPPGLYNPGTPEFRYWETTEALTRGINFWGKLLPIGTVWSALTSPLAVHLVAGQDFNANYSRRFGLRFYEGRLAGKKFYSAESPDVTCHELGHAILDALKPELFNAASAEVDAFHESLGDMSAILSALQFESVRQKVLDETGGRLNVNSRLSRLAEQLGWAIRQLSPTAVDRDCLRNAANRFFYVDPDTLPPSAPSNALASEAHSFSRVFTGAFLDALAHMLSILGTPSPDTLLAISADMGKLLVEGVRMAAVTTNYYSQVAAAMVQAGEAAPFAGKYRAALMDGFVQHGILAPASSAALRAAPIPQMAAGHLVIADDNAGYRKSGADAPDLPTRAVKVMGMSIDVHAPQEEPRFRVASAALGGEAAPRDFAQEAQSFVEDLVQRGQVELEPNTAGIVSSDQGTTDRKSSKKTHTLVVGRDGRMVLKRLHFNCGCAGCRR